MARTETINIPSREIKRIMSDPNLAKFLDKKENRDSTNGGQKREGRFFRAKFDKNKRYHYGTVIAVDNPVDCLVHPEDYSFEFNTYKTKRNYKPVESYTLIAYNIADMEKANKLNLDLDPYDYSNYEKQAYIVNTYIWDISRRVAAKLGFIGNDLSNNVTFEKSESADLKSATPEELIDYINQLESGLFDIANIVDSCRDNFNEDTNFETLTNVIKIINSLNY